VYPTITTRRGSGRAPRRRADQLARPGERARRAPCEALLELARVCRAEARQVGLRIGDAARARQRAEERGVEPAPEAQALGRGRPVEDRLRRGQEGARTVAAGPEQRAVDVEQDERGRRARVRAGREAQGLAMPITP
jgi:hypothetical protein